MDVLSGTSATLLSRKGKKKGEGSRDEGSCRSLALCPSPFQRELVALRSSVTLPYAQQRPALRASVTALRAVAYRRWRTR